MQNNKKRSTPSGGKRSALLRLMPIMAAMLAISADASAATAKATVSAKTKFDLNGHLLITGTSKGINPGSLVTISDAASNQILYSIKTNSKGLFNISVPADQASLCKIKIESGAAVSIIGVSKNKSCSTAPSCVIANGNQKINVDGSVNLSILSSKTAKTDPLQFSWSVSNSGATIVADGNSGPTIQGNTLNQTFKFPGLYHVALNGKNSAGSCKDDIIISVAPTTAPSTVAKLAADATATVPETASALKATDGSYVLLPFEETGMQGGSQINLPFNSQIPYNSLNAQVLVKEAHKPKLRSDSEVKVFYSASVNPNDPAGSDSINSTSQNWFGEGKVGSNNDYLASEYNNTAMPLGPSKNVFLPGQDFVDATIRKTEQWDRMYQKNASKVTRYDSKGVALPEEQTGYDNAWQQNRFVPAQSLAAPDEGIRGNLDNGAAPRTMPGINKPYEENQPQTTLFNADQKAFVAQFIPATNVDDKGRTNPYPVMRVEATLKNAAADAAPVAKADAVFTTASETRCRECHLPGGVAANEDVWRTPVSEFELAPDLVNNATGNAPPDGIPDYATVASGKGSFDDGLVKEAAWPPAIHNHFDDRHPLKTDFTNLAENALNIVDHSTGKVWFNKGLVDIDDNDRRKDRVKASRWVKLDANGLPTTQTSLTRPSDYTIAPSYAAPVDPANPTNKELADIRKAIADAAIQSDKKAYAAGWRLQLQINFKEATAYGDKDDPIAQEKAALFNTLVMHDYMVFYGPTPSVGQIWPASYSSQLADTYSDDDLGKAAAQPQYFCSGHHQSQLKFDVGIAAKVPATNRSDYSRAFHAFHGKMQVYKDDVTAANSADGTAHSKGELIRDSRGHPQMYGGRGWDSQQDDDNGIPLKIQTTVNTSDPQNPVTSYSFADNSGLKNTDPKTWEPWVYAIDSKGNLVLDALGNPTWDTNKFTKFSVPTWDPAKNNWRPDSYPMHSKGQLLLQFGNKVAMEDNCVTCHTGKTEKSYRDIHHAAGLKCDNCHGDMLAVGNVFPNEAFDANLTWAGAMGKDTNNGYTSDAVANLKKSEPNDFRRPWLDEPDCGSCHFGNANGVVMNHGNGTMLMQPDKHLFSAGALSQAWEDGDKTAKTMMPMDARFAVMPTKEQRPEKYTYTDADVAANKVKPTPVPGIVKGNTTYAPQPLSQALYRKSGDVHGSGANGPLTCSTCHGGSHAIWPNPDPKANDNVTSKQLQGYDGNIAECSVCHIKTDFDTGLVATDGINEDTIANPNNEILGVAQGKRWNSQTDLSAPDASKPAKNAFLAGPHGLHPVGDVGNEAWWKNSTAVDKNGASLIHVDDFKSKVGNGGWHSEMTYKPGPDSEDQCAACHGADHKGTRLSKTLTARTFVTDKGKTIKVEAGKVIGCDLCHKMPLSFNRAPAPKAVDGGWPAPKAHMPPMPEAIDPVPAGAKAGMGMSGM